MTDTTYNVIKPDNGVPIKAWTKGVQLEDAARQQLLVRFRQACVTATSPPC
jgi:tRNA-splicing ligase RtcB